MDKREIGDSAASACLTAHGHGGRFDERSALTDFRTFVAVVVVDIVSRHINFWTLIPFAPAVETSLLHPIT